MTPLDPEEEEALTMGRIRHSCTARRGVEGLQDWCCADDSRDCRGLVESGFDGLVN